MVARHLQCVKWGCWGARARALPGGGRGPAGNGSPAGNGCPQHRQLWALSALLGSSNGPAEDSRLFVPLQPAAIAIAWLVSQSWQEEAVPQSVTSLEQAFYLKKQQKDKASFLNSFPQHRVPKVQNEAEQPCLCCPCSAL